MFENLTQRLDEVFSNLRRRGKLSEADVDVAMRQVRLALLEADVNYSVVKDFVARVHLLNGVTKEYRHQIFEDALTEMVIDLQEELAE